MKLACSLKIHNDIEAEKVRLEKLIAVSSSRVLVNAVGQAWGDTPTTAHKDQDAVHGLRALAPPGLDFSFLSSMVFVCRKQ